MKKTLLILISFLALNLFAQSVRITAIVEGDCPTGTNAPRLIELYVDGTVDVSALHIQFQSASGDYWFLNDNIGSGSYTDTFLYLVNDATIFDENFPGIRTATNTTIGSFFSNVEGGEKIRLVDSSNSNQVVDIFGFDGQNGETTTWNFSNSYVKRNANAGPNVTFDESEWTITPKNTLLNKGICWNEPALNTIVGLQAYTLATDEIEIDGMVKIYPNPSVDSLMVTGLTDCETYFIYDVLGNVIQNDKISNSEIIDIQNLKKGIYFIKFDNGISQKFIKK